MWASTQRHVCVHRKQLVHARTKRPFVLTPRRKIKIFAFFHLSSHPTLSFTHPAVYPLPHVDARMCVCLCVYTHKPTRSRAQPPIKTPRPS